MQQADDLVVQLWADRTGQQRGRQLVAAYGTSVVSDLDAVRWLERGAVTGGMRYGVT
ncbi:hypothetical protein [Micromonospora terminaliae]|uniref:Uncharacterized protein n=1 Tax=Micromonospora terminaliae TaxID=1914461 RepID=A0AAJ2ZI95_9ACTN|nr:hypothetical protein [Micromonospora terminaliae]NES30225.1 hypothetical protein [Micromonospora terminaliae]